MMNCPPSVTGTGGFLSVRMTINHPSVLRCSGSGSVTLHVIDDRSVEHAVREVLYLLALVRRVFEISDGSVERLYFVWTMEVVVWGGRTWGKFWSAKLQLEQ